MSEYDDFAIAQADRIAVIDKLGMQVYGTDWSRSEHTLDSHAIGIALEQKSRFYRRTHLATR